MYRDLNNQPVPRKTLEQITIVLQCYLNSPFQFLRTDFTLMYCGDYVSLHEFVLWTYIFRNIVLYHRYTHALIQQIKDYVNVRPFYISISCIFTENYFQYSVFIFIFQWQRCYGLKKWSMWTIYERIIRKYKNNRITRNVSRIESWDSI